MARPPASRAEQRRQRERLRRTRRGRLLLLASAGLSALVLVAWFPAGALLHQRQAQAAASQQLARVRSENSQLRAEARRLSQPAEIGRVARQRYQLVGPDQRAYQVLPPSSAGAGSTLYPGDPAEQPLAAPSAGGATPDPADTTTTLPAPAHHAPAHHAAPSPGLGRRILNTLEFWR